MVLMVEQQPRAPWRVLAVRLASFGLAYAIVESSGELVDWGVHNIADASEFAPKLADLIDRKHPDILTLERILGSRKRRSSLKRIEQAMALAGQRDLATCQFSRADVKRALAISDTSELVARVAALFPELKDTLPRTPKPWRSEDKRIGVFEAIGLAVTTLMRL